MKIAVIGATGFVGSEIVSEALARKHEVDAFSRTPKQIGELVTEVADLNDTTKIKDIIDTHDVTVLSVAGRDDYVGVIAAHQALIAAEPSSRFLVVGGAGSLEVDGVRLYNTDGFPEEYKTEAKTFGAVLDLYRAAGSQLRWSMISPSPEIAPGVRTGKYESGLDSPVGAYVSSQDFAVAVVDELENAAHIRERFTVSSEK